MRTRWSCHTRSTAIHWSFSTLTGGRYGALGEGLPLAGQGRGTAFGLAFWVVAHELALPASEQLNEAVTCASYGIVIDMAWEMMRPILAYVDLPAPSASLPRREGVGVRKIKKHRRPMPTTTIADYAFLSDCQTSALVGRDGAVEWWCPPRFDAPSVFTRMLDPDGGHWTIQPRDLAATTTTTRAYLDDTLVLRTEFTTTSGRMAVTDALAFGFGERVHQLGLDAPHLLLRCVEGITGTVAIAMTCAPRLDYARENAPIAATDTGAVVHGRDATLHLISPLSVDVDLMHRQATAQFDVHAGETVHFALVFTPTASAPAVPSALPHYIGDWLADTVAGWRSWAEAHRDYHGPYVAQVRRSALVLQGLTYRPTGAVVAAATTSLPETPGGTDNYDYRYVWVRDLSLTIRALWIATCPDEVQQFFKWLEQAVGDIHVSETRVNIMYGVCGERELTETTLDHLQGFAGSSPVRIGNDAWRQTQNDVLGEIVDAVYLFRDRLDFVDGIPELVGVLADQAAVRWHDADAGEWEARDHERPYLSGKLLCWVALDRAVQLAPRIGAESRAPGWAVARDAVRATILMEAWSDKAGAYTGAFGSDELDASVLQMVIVGFLLATDPRMRATIAAIERELAPDGLVHRWAGDLNGFLICTYWLVECLAAAGEVERATALFERTTALANDLGLLAEEADADTGALWGNFPQAFSHVGLIDAAWSLGRVGATNHAPDTAM